MTGILLLSAACICGEPPIPTVTLELQKNVFVVGEPIALEFVVGNESDEIVPCRYPNDEYFKSATTLRLEFADNGLPVAQWMSSTTRRVGLSGGARIPGTDRWDTELAPHTALRARFSAIPKLILPNSAEEGTEYRALPAGRYELTGVIPWIEKDKPLRTAPVRIEIVESAREDERQAAALVDYPYISFFTDARSGFDDFQPRESVAKILELYPQSIHAVRIRNRITLLSAERLFWMPPKAVLADERLRGVAHQVEADVKAGLAHKTNDILDLDILDQSARLFLRLEWVEQLEMTSKILDERYPDTEQAKTAREDLAKLKARQRP